MLNPQVFANGLAGMVAAGRRVPGQIAGVMPNEAAKLAVAAGHEAHRAAQAHQQHARTMQHLQGFDAVVQQDNAQRRNGRFVLPPGFLAIPDDYETRAIARVAPDGEPCADDFIGAIQRKAEDAGTPEGQRKKAQAQLKLFEVVASDRPTKVQRAKAALALHGLAVAGDGDTPPCFHVAFQMFMLAQQLDQETFVKHAESMSTLHERWRGDEEWKRRLFNYGAKLHAIPLVRPAVYEFVMVNNNIQPLRYEFGLAQDGVVGGHCLGIDHVMARGGMGVFNGFAGALNVANQMMQGAQIEGRWEYEVSQDAKTNASKRDLRLDLWVQTPMIGGGPPAIRQMPVHLSVVGSRDGPEGEPVLLGIAQDGSLWHMQRSVMRPAQPTAAPTGQPPAQAGGFFRKIFGGRNA